MRASDIGGCVALYTVSYACGEVGVVVSGEVEFLDRLPQQAPFTSCAGVAPCNMRGIKIAHNEEGLVACVLESRLEDVMECVLRVAGRAVDIQYVKLSVSYTLG